MPQVDWSCLPVLPLKCILEHLTVSDALNSTSVCRNWRLALLVYEGRRETLTLNAKDHQKSLFLTRMFRKHTKRLHIYLDCPLDDLEDFIEVILPRFYDTALLYELTIIGSTYLNIKDNSCNIKLNRQITEKLIHAHRHTLQSLALIGCEFDACACDDACFEDNNDISATGLSFLSPHLESFGCKSNSVKGAVFSNLQSLSIDYESIDVELLEGLSFLPQLSHLSLTLTNEKGKPYGRLPNTLLDKQYHSQLEVTVHIIEVPSYRFEEIIENVLIENLPLVAIRVLFCQIVHEPLLMHLINYSNTLRELEWSDAPFDSPLDAVYVKSVDSQFDSSGINPFILICWRCNNLQTIIINGYWIKQYDVIGIARLRSLSLSHVTVSCISASRSHPPTLAPLSLAHTQCLPIPPRQLVQQMNQCLQFKWRPVRKWSDLHPALTPKSTPSRRADYVLQRILDKGEVT